jgi:hypothetical protein
MKARKKVDLSKIKLRIEEEIANKMRAIPETKAFQGAYQSFKILPVKWKGETLDEPYVNFISNSKVP